MHSLGPGSDSKEKQGDDWLRRELPVIFSSDAYTNNGAVFVVWDEGHKMNSPIGMFVISPLAKGGGYASQVSYTHSSLLRTLQEIYGVEPFLGDAANATSLSDLFLLDTVTVAPEGLTLSLSPNPADGSAQFDLNGLVSGATNVIQTSSNLIDWVPVSTQRTATARLPLADVSQTNDRPRFFRALEFR
jgi:hypothetical protein